MFVCLYYFKLQLWLTWTSIDRVSVLLSDPYDMYCAAQSMLHCDYVYMCIMLCAYMCVRVCVCVCVFVDTYVHL